MGLFDFGKKKEAEKKGATCCACGQPKTVLASGEQLCSSDTAGAISIKVLGAGCKSCKEQYEQTKAAIQTMKLAVEVEYITDMEKIMSYGIMRMPAIVVNEKVVSMGQVLNAAQVAELLRKHGCFNEI